MAKPDQELIKLRAALAAKVTSSDFNWFDVTLNYKSSAGTPATVIVQVSNPVKIDGFYLPVTAKETFDFAKSFGWLPLTRAVMDQAHNQAVQISFRSQGNLLDFENYSTALDKVYGPHETTKLVSGAHKLWTLSTFNTKNRAVNYGFYKVSKEASPLSPRLKGWSVIQSLGSKHNEAHWDYSQLLQLMRAGPSFVIDGKTYTLSQAVADGLEAVWDEGTKLKTSSLPTPP